MENKEAGNQGKFYFNWGPLVMETPKRGRPKSDKPKKKNKGKADRPQKYDIDGNLLKRGLYEIQMENSLKLCLKDTMRKLQYDKGKKIAISNKFSDFLETVNVIDIACNDGYVILKAIESGDTEPLIKYGTSGIRKSMELPE